MKSVNITKKLEKEGYRIIYKKWGYWDNIPHVKLDGFNFAIAGYIEKNGALGCRVDFIYNEVQRALYIAQKNNPILLKKIKQVPEQEWYYSRYLILSMEDYYLYKRQKYPYNEYWQILERLRKEDSKEVIEN